MATNFKLYVQEVKISISENGYAYSEGLHMGINWNSNLVTLLEFFREN